MIRYDNYWTSGCCSWTCSAMFKVPLSVFRDITACRQWPFQTLIKSELTDQLCIFGRVNELYVWHLNQKFVSKGGVNRIKAAAISRSYCKHTPDCIVIITILTMPDPFLLWLYQVRTIFWHKIWRAQFFLGSTDWNHSTYWRETEYSAFVFLSDKQAPTCTIWWNITKNTGAGASAVNSVYSLCLKSTLSYQSTLREKNASSLIFAFLVCFLPQNQFQCIS